MRRQFSGLLKWNIKQLNHYRRTLEEAYRSISHLKNNMHFYYFIIFWQVAFSCYFIIFFFFTSSSGALTLELVKYAVRNESIGRISSENAKIVTVMVMSFQCSMVVAMCFLCPSTMIHARTIRFRKNDL